MIWVVVFVLMAAGIMADLDQINNNYDGKEGKESFDRQNWAAFLNFCTNSYCTKLTRLWKSLYMTEKSYFPVLKDSQRERNWFKSDSTNLVSYLSNIYVVTTTSCSGIGRPLPNFREGKSEDKWMVQRAYWCMVGTYLPTRYYYITCPGQKWPSTN